ncbi:MAG: glutamate 5-kinase [Lachnospiraceae bacterium]|nr:glutamate 5-kinase [Lachnospiraceae bacterium]MDD3796582.1 glutamate 5-kinase [Lachnospiraceae bacterium]
MNLINPENIRESLKDKKRIVIKIGTSSITHEESGALNLTKLEILVRELCDLKNQGKDIILVSSGAIAVGRQAVHLSHRPTEISEKQACAAIGQAQLMMIYQKLFHEYGHLAAQILMTKDTVSDATGKENALNTFEELLSMGVIPIVNENDTISTYEIQFGDNDRLSAIVASLTHSDLLILLSDIDGLFTDDPNHNPEARFIPLVTELNAHLMKMGKGTLSDVGTGGMEAKLHAARIATDSGADMIIANGADFHVIHKIIQGKEYGTLFCANRN